MPCSASPLQPPTLTPPRARGKSCSATSTPSRSNRSYLLPPNPSPHMLILVQRGFTRW